MSNSNDVPNPTTPLVHLSVIKSVGLSNMILEDYAVKNPGVSVNSLRDSLKGPLRPTIKLQLFSMVEYCLPLVKACYFLEG